MLQTYAVSLLSETPDGGLEHLLYVIEADSVDTAEGRAMARTLKAGRLIRSLLSRSCELGAAPALADLA